MLSLARWAAGAAMVIAFSGCPQKDPPPAPPIPPPTSVTPVPVAPTPGLVNVTVSATSTPVGAHVQGGGRPLGTTPLTAQVPIPAPAPGQPPPSFDFVFTLAGFDPETVRAAPVNGRIDISATLVAAGTTPPDEGGEEGEEGEEVVEGGRELSIASGSGGALRDHQTATAAAEVGEACTIGRLSVAVRGRHSYHRDLVLTLVAPSGERYTLQRSQNRNPFRTYRVPRAVGEEARGRWTLRVDDTLDEDSGNLGGFTLNLVCK
jgi:hypothetical protein